MSFYKLDFFCQDPQTRDRIEAHFRRKQYQISINTELAHGEIEDAEVSLLYSTGESLKSQVHMLRTQEDRQKAGMRRIFSEQLVPSQKEPRIPPPPPPPPPHLSATAGTLDFEIQGTSIIHGLEVFYKGDLLSLDKSSGGTHTWWRGFLGVFPPDFEENPSLEVVYKGPRGHGDFKIGLIDLLENKRLEVRTYYGELEWKSQFVEQQDTLGLPRKSAKLVGQRPEDWLDSLDSSKNLPPNRELSQKAPPPAPSTSGAPAPPPPPREDPSTNSSDDKHLAAINKMLLQKNEALESTLKLYSTGQIPTCYAHPMTPKTPKKEDQLPAIFEDPLLTIGYALKVQPSEVLLSVEIMNKISLTFDDTSLRIAYDQGLQVSELQRIPQTLRGRAKIRHKFQIVSLDTFEALPKLQFSFLTSDGVPHSIELGVPLYLTTFCRPAHPSNFAETMKGHPEGETHEMSAIDLNVTGFDEVEKGLAERNFGIIKKEPHPPHTVWAACNYQNSTKNITAFLCLTFQKQSVFLEVRSEDAALNAGLRLSVRHFLVSD